MEDILIEYQYENYGEWIWRPSLKTISSIAGTWKHGLPDGAEDHGTTYTNPVTVAPGYKSNTVRYGARH